MPGTMLDVGNKIVCRNIQYFPYLGLALPPTQNTTNWPVNWLHFIGSYQICPFQLWFLFVFAQTWRQFLDLGIRAWLISSSTFTLHPVLISCILSIIFIESANLALLFLPQQ